MALKQRKYARIKVPHDDYDHELSRAFEDVVMYSELRYGRLLARGMYLAIKELEDDEQLRDKLKFCRIRSELHGTSFDETLVVDREAWLAAEEERMTRFKALSEIEADERDKANPDEFSVEIICEIY